MADPDSTNQPTAVFTAAYEVTEPVNLVGSVSCFDR